MKKKHFYNNRKRNQKWTEEPVGRKIDFADKYIEGEGYSDKYNSKRSNSFEQEKKKKRKQRLVTRIIAVAVGLSMICVGYTGMDIYMTRHAVPAEIIGSLDDNEQGSMSELAFDISAYRIDSVSLDSSVMLSSVIHEVTENGFTAVAFDAKREDGTVGYTSSLASVDTFSAMSHTASQPAKSVRELLANDILPVARISCYKDNVVPAQADNMAILSGEGRLFADKDGNNYLNPESDLTYSYIKDIIQECYSYGITVFSLYNCNLPDDIADGYNDGFDSLVNKLNNDFDGNIKFLEEKEVEIIGIDAESGNISTSAIKEEVNKIEKTNSNSIYLVSARKASQKVLNELKRRNNISYIFCK